MKKKSIFTSVMALLFAGSAMAQTNATSITDGGYYRMYVPKSSVSLYANGNYLQKTQAAEGDNTDVFQFNASSTSGQYTIKCVANSKYLGDFASSSFAGQKKTWLTISDTSQDWQVTRYSSTNYSDAWTIGKPNIAATDDGWMNYNAKGAVLSWKVVDNSTEDENSYFYLYPLSEYTVTVNGAGAEETVNVTVEDGSRKSTTTADGKVYLENAPSESTTCTASDGYSVNGVTVSGTTITVEVSKDNLIYYAPESAVNMAIKSGDYYITQKNNNGSIYYADFLDCNLRTAGKKTSKSGDDLPNLNWTFTISPVETGVAAKGVTIKTKDGNAYLCSQGYVKVGTDADVLYFVKESEDATTFAITSDKTNYWTKGEYGWDSGNGVNYIKTSTTPEYSFTLEDVVLKYYDGTTASSEGYTFTSSDQNICAVIARVCNTTSWYTMCLPFAISNVETTFGTGSKAATLTSFADNKFKFTSQTTIAANTPFILKPGQETVALTNKNQSNAYTAYSVNGTKEESGTTESSVTGATFTGVYKSGNVPQDSYFIGEGNKFYHAADGTNTIDPFRAYLTINTVENGNTGTSKAKSISFEIDGETTDIRFINNEPVNVEDGIITDLSGRRVENPSKGVYIMNNKKVIIK